LLQFSSLALSHTSSPSLKSSSFPLFLSFSVLSPPSPSPSTSLSIFLSIPQITSLALLDPLLLVCAVFTPVVFSDFSFSHLSCSFFFSSALIHVFHFQFFAFYFPLFLS
jgi:hypothetical protein